MLNYKNLKLSVLSAAFWDRFGIGISGLCAIHCLAFPVIISVLPALPLAASINEYAHPVFILILIPVVLFAGKRSHFDRKIMTFLISGLILITAGWGIGHFWLGDVFEIGFTVLGSLLLIYGHWKNYRHHQVCSNSRHLHHPEIEEIKSTELT